MKQNLAWIATLLAAIALAACSSATVSNNPSSSPAQSEPGSPLLAAEGENALPVELQLAYGTLNLEDTENEFDAQTAADLLPLWKAVRSLSGSDTVAPDEIQALFKQIQETMTTEQLQAIADMRLTRATIAELSQKLGLQFGAGGGGFENMSPEVQATLEAARESGQIPRGGFEGGGSFVPGGGGFGPGGEPGQVDPELQATAQARRTQRAGTNPGIPAPVLDAVISYLEGKR